MPWTQMKDGLGIQKTWKKLKKKIRVTNFYQATLTTWADFLGIQWEKSSKVLPHADAVNSNE